MEVGMGLIGIIDGEALIEGGETKSWWFQGLGFGIFCSLNMLLILGK